MRRVKLWQWSAKFIRAAQHIYIPAVQALHLVMKGSLDLMSVGIGKEKRKKDTVAENTTSEKPGTDQKELGDVKYAQYFHLLLHHQIL